MLILYLRFLFNALFTIPLLPLLIIQAVMIRKKVPELPEAADPKGVVELGTKESFSLVTIGESTIAGVGVKSHEEGFSGSLAKEISNHLNKTVEWQVSAKSGYTAAKVTDEIIPEIDLNEIDLIIIGLGGNDTFKFTAPWTWNKNIRKLVTALQSKYPTTPIAFLNMPPIKDFPAFTSLVQMILGAHVSLLGKCLEKNVKSLENVYYYPMVISLDEWLNKLGRKYEVKDFFSDGVHPSALTYQTWARFFAEYLINNNIVKKN